MIDRQLERAGWAAEQIRREYPASSAPADYVLFDDGSPVAVVEAKRTARQVELGLDQAARYAGHLGVHFIYAANSRRILFQDPVGSRGRSASSGPRSISNTSPSERRASSWTR